MTVTKFFNVNRTSKMTYRPKTTLLFSITVIYLVAFYNYLPNWNIEVFSYGLLVGLPIASLAWSKQNTAKVFSIIYVVGITIPNYEFEGFSFVFGFIFGAFLGIYPAIKIHAPHSYKILESLFAKDNNPKKAEHYRQLYAQNMLSENDPSSR